MIDKLIEKLVNEDFRDQFKPSSRENAIKRLGHDKEYLEKEAVSMLRMTWNVIASDLFSIINAGLPKSEQTTEFSGDAVREIVDDYVGSFEGDSVGTHYWELVSQDEQHELLKKAFPDDKTYG